MTQGSCVYASSWNSCNALNRQHPDGRLKECRMDQRNQTKQMDAFKYNRDLYMSEMNPNRLHHKILIFPCGGISSVGRLTLLAAQELVLEGKGEWVCLQHFKELPQLGKKAVFTSRLIVVDGCEKQCGKKYVAQLGRLLEFHLSLADLGIEISKGDEEEVEDLQLIKDAIIAESTRLSKQPALFLGNCSCR